MMSEDTGECVSCDKLSEQVEKLTKERDELHRAFNQPVPRSEWEKMQEQLAALAEQNEKMRSFFEFAWKDIPMSEYAFEILEHVMNLPNLATPLVSEYQKDAELLDYIQNHGATIQIVPMANRTFGFEVGGLHKSRKLSVREAIGAAMQEDKKP